LTGLSVFSSPPMTLQDCLAECMEAVDLFLNNRFTESLDKLRPHMQDSMYHAVMYATMLEMQAMMTFQHDDIVRAGNTMKSAQEVCQRWGLHLRGGDALYVCVFPEQLHAELCYAECLLQRAALTFLQVRRLPLPCFREGGEVRSLPYSRLNHFQLEGGVSFGIGAFNLTLSLFPARILRLLEFAGLSGDKEYGLSQLHSGATSLNLRSMLCALLLLCYYTFLSFILGNSPSCICYGTKTPCCSLRPGAIFLFFAGRTEEIRGNIDEAVALFEDGCRAQQAWKQFHHMCYWELLWCFTYKRVWKMAYFYADLLSQESRWSKAMYVYMKAACLSMLPDDEVRPFGENEVELFRQVPTFKQKIAGKSPPTEKFAIRKARRYKSSSPTRLPVPVLEMMYMWNGFTMIRSRPDLTRGMMETLVDAERALQDRPVTEYSVDDSCVIQLLKGMCLKNDCQTKAAEDCFQKVINSEKKIKFDEYLVPNALLELGLLYIDLGRKDQAVKLLQKAKNNYKEYSMESRTQFRIHAALTKLKADISEEEEESTDL
uniref:Zgc:158403 n=1 Tax=Paramormyrops kingsleyae TaxID=1676925 RepID=A0A3B3S6I1_9TELE